MEKVFPYGSQTATVSAGDSVGIFTAGEAKLYYRRAEGGSYFYFVQKIEGEQILVTPPSGVVEIRIDARAEEVIFDVGTSPEVGEFFPEFLAAASDLGYKIISDDVVVVGNEDGSSVVSPNVERNTIADAGTITVGEHRNQVLFQDASGGSVTMTTATATELATEFSTLEVGNCISQYVASNHATNTSTISGGTGVTLVGSGAVTNTGGTFLLVKTDVTTFDLVRVG